MLRWEKVWKHKGLSSLVAVPPTTDSLSCHRSRKNTYKTQSQRGSRLHGRPSINEYPSRFKVFIFVFTVFASWLDGWFFTSFRNRRLKRRAFLLALLEREPQALRAVVGRLENYEEALEEDVAEDAERHAAVTLNAAVASR